MSAHCGPRPSANIPGDPYYQNVVLLLKGEGTNGSTIFTDSSKYGSTVTLAGGANISTAQKKYGNSSMVFDGNGDGATVGAANDTKFIIGTKDCTIEAWIYVVGAGLEYGAPSASIYGRLDSTNAAYWFNEWLLINTTNLNVAFSTNTARGSSTYYSVGTPNNTIVLNTWHHVAFVKRGAVWTIFVDGVNKVSQTVLSDLGSYANFYASIARTPSSNSTAYKNSFNGYIDNLRVTIGVARYTNDFTPPGEF